MSNLSVKVVNDKQPNEALTITKFVNSINEIHDILNINFQKFRNSMQALGFNFLIEDIESSDDKNNLKV